MLTLLTYPAVIVQTPGGENLFLEVQPLYTIERVKAIIEGKKGVPTSGFKLQYGDQPLEDGRTLIGYNIQDGAVLTMAPGKAKCSR